MCGFVLEGYHVHLVFPGVEWDGGEGLYQTCSNLGFIFSISFFLSVCLARCEISLHNILYSVGYD